MENVPPEKHGEAIAAAIRKLATYNDDIVAEYIKDYSKPRTIVHNEQEKILERIENLHIEVVKWCNYNTAGKLSDTNEKLFAQKIKLMRDFLDAQLDKFRPAMIEAGAKVIDVE
jgi:hypothetical protein